MKRLFLCLCLLAGLCGLEAEASQPAFHWIEVDGVEKTSTSGTFTVDTDSEIWIEIRFENNYGSPKLGGITTSFSSFRGSILGWGFDAFQKNSPTECKYVPAGSTVWHKNGSQMTSTKPIIESYEGWWFSGWYAEDENQTLKIKIHTGSSADTFYIYTRGWLTEDDWATVDNNPSSGYTDQQGHYAYRYTVKVEKPNRAPEKPSDLRVDSSSIDEDSAKVRWEDSTDPDGDTVHYRIEYGGFLSSPSWTVDNSDETSLYETITGLGPDKRYDVRVMAFDNNGGVSDWTTVYNLFKTLPVDCVSTPNRPSASKTTAAIGESITFSTGGSTCTREHSVSYSFNWGDGYNSSYGSSSQSHSYSSAGTYNVYAKAKCSGREYSSSSSTRAVTIIAPPQKATSATPSNGSGSVPIDADSDLVDDLSWQNGGGATSYDIYFGTDSSPDSGEYKKNQSGTSYDPGELETGRTYYWRINAKNSVATTQGDIWSFTTAGNSGAGPATGNRNKQEYGDALYDEFNFGGYNYNHAGLFAGIDRNGIPKTFESSFSDFPEDPKSPGQGPQEGNFNERFTGSSYYGAFSSIDYPSGMPFQKRMDIVRKAREVVDADISYPYLTLNAINPQSDFGSHLDLNEISSIRCDGFVEYAYERNDVRVWRNCEEPDAEWNIAEFPSHHNNNMGNTRDPHFELSPWAQRGAPPSTGPIIFGNEYTGPPWPDTRMTKAAVVKPPSVKTEIIETAETYVIVRLHAIDESGIWGFKYMKPMESSWTDGVNSNRHPVNDTYTRDIRLTNEGKLKVKAIDQGGNEAFTTRDIIFLPDPAKDPSPVDGDSNCSINTDLSWENGGGAINFDVYFGTDSVLGSSEFKGNQSSMSYNLNTLQHSTAYYWRIDSKNSTGITQGDVWSFTTIPPEQVAISSVIPASGKYSSPLEIRTTCSPDSATVRYTIDGSEPTESSPAVFGTTTVVLPETGSLTVKCKAFKSGWTASDTITRNYSGEPVLSGISISGPSTVNENSSTSYTCTAHYSNGNDLTVTPSSWNVDAPHTITDNGGLLAREVDSDQQCTITAAYGEKTATCAIVVRNLTIPTCGLTVTSGSGDGSYTNGQQVVITADASPTGQMFNKWTGEITFIANVNSSSTTITMPSQNITVTATYKEKGKPDLIVSNTLLLSETVETNGSVSVTVVTKNVGNADATSISSNYFETALFLSTSNNFVSMSQSELDVVKLEITPAQPITGLATGASITNTYTFNAPTVSNTYYICAKADQSNNINESNETNNFGAPATLTAFEKLKNKVGLIIPDKNDVLANDSIHHSFMEADGGVAYIDAIEIKSGVVDLNEYGTLCCFTYGPESTVDTFDQQVTDAIMVAISNGTVFVGSHNAGPSKILSLAGLVHAKTHGSWNPARPNSAHFNSVSSNAGIFNGVAMVEIDQKTKPVTYWEDPSRNEQIYRFATGYQPARYGYSGLAQTPDGYFATGFGTGFSVGDTAPRVPYWTVGSGRVFIIGSLQYTHDQANKSGGFIGIAGQKILENIGKGLAHAGTSELEVADLALLNLTAIRSLNLERFFKECSFDVKNNGPTALSSEFIMLNYYLSDDTVFGNADDKRIGDTGLTISIPSGETLSINLTTLGLTNMVDLWTTNLVNAGDYYLFADVRIHDGTPFDPVTSNNFDRTSGTYHYVAGQPDLIISDTSFLSETVETNGSVSVTVVTKNVGNADATPISSSYFETALFLSTSNNFVSMSQNELDVVKLEITPSQPITGLATDASITNTYTFNAPTVSNTYYICVKADESNSVNESNETNNFGAPVTLMVLDGGSNPHFQEVGGNPSEPTWDIYLAGATLNGLPLEKGDELAIYDGSTLVGSFKLTGNLTDEQKFNHVLKAFSSLTSGYGYTTGNTVLFRCWDISSGKEYTGTVAWSNPSGGAYTDSIFPSASDAYSVGILKFGMRTQNISLRAGYQFISLNTLPENLDVLAVLSNVLDHVGIVKDSSANTIRKIGSNWINGVGNWSKTDGYLIKMNDAATLTVTGIPIPENTPINLRQGYQFISYLPETPKNALEVLAEVLDRTAIIKDSRANTIRKIGANWINGIGDMKSDEGYLVKMNNPDTLHYSQNTQNIPFMMMTAQVGEFQAIAPQGGRHFPEVSGDPSKPTWDIYLAGATLNNSPLEAGDELAIYDGSTLVGSFILMDTLIESEWANHVLKAFSMLDNNTGYIAGNSYTLKLWDASANTEYQATAEFQTLENAYTETVFPSENDLYSLMTLSANEDPDSDADGLPDWWEKKHFGESTTATASALCSNGVNTILQAYIAGLDPTDPQSVFSVSALDPSFSLNIIQWNAISGRVYSVYWTTNLLNGFQCLESNILWPQGAYTNPNTVPYGYYKTEVQLVK